MNSAASRRRSRRKGCRRNQRRQSGGEGYAQTFGASVDPQNPSLGNAAEVLRFPSCEFAQRPGYLEGAAAAFKGGLPGFAGGARRRRNRRRTLKGGRYAQTMEVVNGVGLMQPTQSGCGNTPVANPLNQTDYAKIITAPPAVYSQPIPNIQAGGRRRSRRNRRQNGGVGGVDSMVQEAPRSGYTTWPSNSAGGDAGTLSDGKTPFLVNVPYSAQPTPSAACLKTGGARRNIPNKIAIPNTNNYLVNVNNNEQITNPTWEKYSDLIIRMENLNETKMKVLEKIIDLKLMSKNSSPESRQQEYAKLNAANQDELKGIVAEIDAAWSDIDALWLILNVFHRNNNSGSNTQNNNNSNGAPNGGKRRHNSRKNRKSRKGRKGRKARRTQRK